MTTSSYEMAGAGFGAGSFIVGLIIAIVILVGLWKVYDKAGEPGWGVLIPFYNTYLLFKIAFGSGWLFLLMLVPIVNFVIEIMLFFKLAKAFGHGVGFGFGLLFLNPIFICILGFGDSEYVGA